jgi:peptidoglycan hydrolase-like protein with peptidoglycan-binding domain
VAAVSSAAVRVKVPPYPVLRQGSTGPAVRRLQQSLVALRYLPAASVTGAFDERTWHAVVAFQGWEQLGRTGVVARQTWVRLERAGVPRPWDGLRTGVEIDTGRQVLLLVRGGTTVRAVHVSTGAGGRTPRGHFSVRSKALMSWSVPFQVWMPYAQYFYGGFAMHSYPSVPAYPASHGCVRLPSMEAPVVYAFTWVGMPVWIR